MNRTPENRMEAMGAAHLSALIRRQPLLDQLFAASGAQTWGLTREAFATTVERSAAKHFGNEAWITANVEKYLSGLNLRDLALACACAEGRAEAWDHFVSTYRSYLRSAAGAILRCPQDSPASCELADSLFADLYGLSQGADRCSLFRYFHGRSSLRSWLRAVLAQRHIDAIRASRRFTDIEGMDGHATAASSPSAIRPQLSTASAGPLQDPHRAELVVLFRRALEVALGLLDSGDRERLRLYYAAEQTLAAIGRSLGEHESTVSRNLERTRRELRHHVEVALRKGRTSPYHAAVGVGLSDDQIGLCFEYAAEDASIDLDKRLPDRQTAVSKGEGRKQ
jgi:RNA polymerase sigma factor (sigma-70 family)